MTHSARLEDLDIRQTHKNGAVSLDLSASVSKGSPDACRIEFELRSPTGEALIANAKVVANKVKAKIRITDPELWWPSGSGEQPLYQVTARLRNNRTAKTMRIFH
ncbi:MAG: hypothetical protein WEB60_10965 [Terrimicrobiaceae bacterium]